VISALIACLVGKKLLHVDSLGFAALFLCGMTAASLVHEGYGLRWSDRSASLLAMGSLTCVFVTAQVVPAINGYGTVVAILLAVFFYSVCSGASLFGLLLTRPARRLGHISYSIYLLQGLVLTVLFASPVLRNFALSASAQYWMVGSLCAGVLVAVSSVTYYGIELPGMRFGRTHGAQNASATVLNSPPTLASE
jgi:peptidoglycan/LPS O-acetylase OafA/YrhL